MIYLGVNIDHVATLRQARMAHEPDPVWAAAICELAGASNITVHLREDRRHIQDRDLSVLRETVRTKLNLEMANAPLIVEIALRTRPDQITFVPEKRQELTTEGGLDVLQNLPLLRKSIARLKKKGIQVGVFIDANLTQVEVAKEAGSIFVEFHTGRFADARSDKARKLELDKLHQASELAHRLNLRVHAGHGLHYQNIDDIVQLPYLEEINIGHAIVARAIFVGLEKAVREMVELIRQQTSDNRRQTNKL